MEPDPEQYLSVLADRMDAIANRLEAAMNWAEAANVDISKITLAEAEQMMALDRG